VNGFPKTKLNIRRRILKPTSNTHGMIMIQYNGPKTKLMDELLTALTDRYDIGNCDDWATIELYLARACSVLEQAGWKKEGKD